VEVSFGQLTDTSNLQTAEMDGGTKLTNIMQFFFFGEGVIGVLWISGGIWQNLQFQGVF